MQVGSLVRRTRHSHHKIGVVLRASWPMDKKRPSFWIHWFNLDPSEERHGWFRRSELEVINESR